jgi:hypothetical protein
MKDFADPATKTAFIFRLIGDIAGAAAEKIRQRFGLALAWVLKDMEKSRWEYEHAGMSLGILSKAWEAFGKLAPGWRGNISDLTKELERLWKEANKGPGELDKTIVKIGNSFMPMARNLIEVVEMQAFTFSGVLRPAMKAMPLTLLQQIPSMRRSFKLIELSFGSTMERIKEKAKETWDYILIAANAATSGMQAISNQYQQNLTIGLDNEYKKRLAYINATITNEDEKQKALIALDAEYDIKRRASQREGAKMAKGVAFLEAIVNTASGVTRALKDFPFPFSAIIAGIIAGLGAVQVGLIMAQPLPLAKGGIITQPTYALIGERGPEAVIPLNQTHNRFSTINLHFNISTLDADSMERVVQYRIVPRLQRMFKSEVALVHPNAVRSY